MYSRKQFILKALQKVTQLVGDPIGEDEYLVRSTWRSVEDWKTWLYSKERTTIQREIDAITGEATEYRMYEPLVVGIIPKYTDKGNVPLTEIPL